MTQPTVTTPWSRFAAGAALTLGLLGAGPGCDRGRSGGGDDDDSAVGDDDTTSAGDDDSTAPGDDDTTPSGDDDTTPAGDDDTTPPGDDDTINPGDDDTTTPGDDDTTNPGDDDTAPPDAVWGDVLVTEVMANPAAVLDEFGEWVEFRSLVSWPLDLSGWTLADQGTDQLTLSPGVPLLLPPMGFLVVGITTDTSLNGLAPTMFGYGTGMYLSNTQDEVVLSSPGGVIVAELIYGLVGWPNGNGGSTMLSADAMSASAAADYLNWCVTDAAYTYGLGDRGTPAAANPTCF